MPDTVKVSSVARDLEKPSEELAALVWDWGRKLAKSPSIIWDEASSFTNVKFLARNRKTTVTFKVPRRLEDSEISSRPLCTISNTSKDGDVSVTVSIWPSQCYQGYWSKLDLFKSFSTIQQFCTGWIARFKLRSLGIKIQRLVDVRVPFEGSEIALQMRQSSRSERLDHWKTSFPLCISEDARSFVILRTLFVMRPATDTEPASCSSWVIPMEFSDLTKSQWSLLETFDPRRHNGVPAGLHSIIRGWYNYSLTFSPDGRRLFFSDHRTPFMTQMAIFQIYEQTTLSAYLIAYETVRTV